jgi:predicted dehydrogenase
MLKVGILGCGKMGHVYARWFQEHPECQLKALYNRTRSRAEALGEQYPDAEVFDHWEDLIKSGVDIIGICTPSHEHAAQFEWAIENGKHVLCEKPMAADIHQARRMAEAAGKSGVVTMIGFQMRFHPVILKVKELLPRIGPVFHLDWVFGMHRPEITWRHKAIQSGGVMKELACHLFDLGYSWLGEYESISSMNRIIRRGREVEDYSVNIFRFRNGTTGYLSANYEDRRSRAIKCNLFGLRGQIEFQFSSYEPDDSKVFYYRDEGNKEEIPVDIPGKIDEVYPGHLDSFQKEIDEFVFCIMNASMPSVGCREGAYALEIIDAAYESSRVGQRVNLPLAAFDVTKIKDCFDPFWEG